MIEIAINLGIMGILFYIATKMAVVNDVTHEIRDILKGGNPPPPTSSSENEI